MVGQDQTQVLGVHTALQSQVYSGFRRLRTIVPCVWGRATYGGLGAYKVFAWEPEVPRCLPVCAKHHQRTERPGQDVTSVSPSLLYQVRRARMVREGRPSSHLVPR